MVHLYSLAMTDYVHMPRLGGVKFGITRQRLSELSLIRNIMGTTSL